MISTPTRGVGLGRKTLVFLAGLALAGAGMLALAQSEAKASSTGTTPTVGFGQGVFKLGEAFPGSRVLPAPANLGTSALPNWQDVYSPANAPLTFAGTCTQPSITLPGPTTLTPSNFPCGNNPGSASLKLGWNPGTGAVGANTTLGPTPIPNPASPGTVFPDPTVAINEAFSFPIMVLPSPLDQSPIPFSVAATGPVSGTYSWPSAEGTGKLEFEVGLEVRVLAGLGQTPADPFTYCKIPLTGTGTGGAVKFTSDGAGDFPGTAYNFGLQGSGAVAAEISNQEDATPVGPQAAAEWATGACNRASGVTKGEGVLWLGNRQAEEPICKDDEEGSYPDCFVPTPNFDRVKVTPAKKTIKGGKKVTLKVFVRNNGTGDGTATVKLKSNKAGIAKVPGSVKIDVPFGEEKSKNVTVTTKKKKKGKAVITATVGSKSAKSTITVKK